MLATNFRSAQKTAVLTATALIALLSPVTAAAQALSENLPFIAEPDSQWIVVLSQGELRSMKADLMKTPEVLHLSAVVPSLPDDYLTAGVVRFTNGRVVSSPLHPPGRVEIPRESTRVALEKIAALSQKTAQLKRREEELDQEAKRLRRSLRHDAGLDEVDQIYGRIAALEGRLRELGAEDRISE